MNKYTFPSFSDVTDHSFSLMLSGFGIFLAVCELYKQIFMYYIINHGHYDWWFFPFQLCSTPMYLCLLLPFLPTGPFKTRIYTFMQNFCILGGIAALIIPEGFSNIHWSLTLHGYMWHIALIIISLLILIAGRADISWKGYFRSLPLFCIFCTVATLINVAAPGHGQANMFYISPFTETTQPIFRQLAAKIGIIPSNLLYLITVCIGAAIVHYMFIHCTTQITRGKYQKA
ncbi:MAG: hypothetical protein ACRDBO_21275 [Lachnospiraceae bacterium]